MTFQIEEIAELYAGIVIIMGQNTNSTSGLSHPETKTYSMAPRLDL